MTEATMTVSDTVRRIAHTLSASQARMLLQIAGVNPIEPRDNNARHMLLERALVTTVGSAESWCHILTDMGKTVVALLRENPDSLVIDADETLAIGDVPHLGNFPTDALDESLAKRERDVQARLLKKERERFNELKADIRDWKGSGKRGTWQADFLSMLRKHGTLSRAQAVRWLHISDTTFANNPPTPLIRAGLIRVSGKRGNFNYIWSARGKLASAFPNLDAAALEMEIL